MSPYLFYTDEETKTHRSEVIRPKCQLSKWQNWNPDVGCLSPLPTLLVGYSVPNTVKHFA